MHHQEHNPKNGIDPTLCKNVADFRHPHYNTSKIKPFWGTMLCWLLPYEMQYLNCALAEMIDQAVDTSLVIHNNASHSNILPYAIWSGAANPAKNSIAYTNTTVITNFSHIPVVHSDNPKAIVDAIQRRVRGLTLLPAFEWYVRIFCLDRWCMINSRFPTIIENATYSDLCPHTVYYFTETAFIGSHRVDTRTEIQSTFTTATEPLLGRPPLLGNNNNGWLILNPVSLFACIVVDRMAQAVPENAYVYTAAERCWLIHVFRAKADIDTQWFMHQLEDSASELQRAYKLLGSHTTSHESRMVCAKLAKILSLSKATDPENGRGNGKTEWLQISSHTR